MDILVVGLGTIGAIHGYLFRQAGHHVEHLIREGSAKAGIEKLEVAMLDGRIDSKGSSYTDEYPVLRCSRDSYDLVFASVPCGGIGSVVDELSRLGIDGPILLACGTWEDRRSIEAALRGRPHILGYPVAGGGIAGGKLTC